MVAEVKTEHPHVVRKKGVKGGRPVIRGTGIPVQSVVEQIALGDSPQDIAEAFEGTLNLAQIYGALSYYHDHKEEIDRDIEENKLENVLKEHNASLDGADRIVFRHVEDQKSSKPT